MKKILYVLSLCAIGLTFNACQKDYNATPDSPNENINNTRGTFTCYVNGTFFEGEIKTFVRNTEDGANSLTITAVDYMDTRRQEDARTITFNINNFDGAKVYEIPAQATMKYTWSYTDQGNSNYTIGLPNNDGVAILDIQEYENNIKGNFQLKLRHATNISDTLTITDGIIDFPIN